MSPDPSSSQLQGGTAILLATGNPHKVIEISEIVASSPDAVDFRFIPASDFPDIPEPEETGTTFAENAILKARYWAEATGRLALADDSGIIVDALDGRPGVYSARYDTTSTRRNEKLLRELQDVQPEERTARFVCVAAIADPQGRVHTEEGRIEGWIVEAPKGTDGFGYDPVFEPVAASVRAGRTLAEYSAEEKNAVSHRGKAFIALTPRIIEAIKAGGVVTAQGS